MNGEDQSGLEPGSAAKRTLRFVEDGILALVLAGIVFVPLLEMLLRGVFRTGLAGANAFTQHFTLFVSLIGGMVAAREGRLLALSRGFPGLRQPWGELSEFLRAGMAGGVSALLAVAGVQFFLFERESGQTLPYGIPVWILQSVIAVGFGVIALRLVWSARGVVARSAAFALALAVILLVTRYEPASMTPAWIGLGILGLAVIAGAPIFVALGGVAVFLFWVEFNPLASLALDYYRLATNPTIPALPLFTAAGYFLAEGGASRRLVRVFRSLVGGVRMGPAVVTVAVFAFFTSLTGASGVTILALGGLLLPFLRSAGFFDRGAIGLLTGSGSLGLLFAPCLPLILYAIVAQVEIRTMFLAGVIPGLLLLGVTVAWTAFVPREPHRGAGREPWRFDGREARAAIWDAKWELLIPVISLGGIFSGLATPVEAAALTAAYAFVVEVFVYRDLRFDAKLLRVARECGLIIGGILLILGVAQGFTNYLVHMEVPAQLVDLVTGHISSKIVFLLLLTLFLLAVGCVMDVYSATIVVVPLILPLGPLFGIDPVHLGILFLANLGLGYLTPPVGMNLFIASYRFDRPMSEVLAAVWPYFLLQLGGVLLISFVPALTLSLPRWFGF